MIASNTKALTTLMLAKLVDRGQADAGTRRSRRLLPTFKLGDADTTKQVLVQAPDLRVHRPAAPGPRVAVRVRRASTPASALEDARRRCSRRASSASCSSTRTRWPPPPASSAGHVSRIRTWSSAPPTTRRCRSQVFDPLGMKATTFDYARALARQPRRRRTRLDVDGKPAPAVMEVNYAIIPVRPAGAAWSNVRRHAASTSQMELARRQAAGRQALHPEGAAARARAAPQVAIGKDDDLRHGPDGRHAPTASRSSTTAAT